MALSQKEVFYALARNHGVTARALCKKADVSYGALVKRLGANTANKMKYVETAKLCSALDVSLKEFQDLMQRAADNEFPDNHPLDSFMLPVMGVLYSEERTISEMLTPEEYLVIKAMRESEKKAVDRARKISREKLIAAAAEDDE